MTFDIAVGKSCPALWALSLGPPIKLHYLSVRFPTFLRSREAFAFVGSQKYSSILCSWYIEYTIASSYHLPLSEKYWLAQSFN